MVKTLFSTILLAGVLGVFVMETAAKDKKPKGTPVTCGDTISVPGNYFLAADCTGAGITISASRVTLSLKGHTMTGTAGGGISLFNVSRVNIIGSGTINFPLGGIFFNNVHNSVIEKLSVMGSLIGIQLVNSTGNDIRKNDVNDNQTRGIGLFGSTDNQIEENELSGNDVGIFLNNTSSDNQVEDNEANGNDVGIEVAGFENKVEDNEANGNDYGIFVGQNANGNEIEENETNDNNRYGIFLAANAIANEIEENTALNNTTEDLHDTNVNCDNNEWEDNRFNTANQPCID